MTEEQLIALAEQATGLTGRQAVLHASFERACWYFSYGPDVPRTPPFNIIPKEAWEPLHELARRYNREKANERQPAPAS